MSNFPPQQEVSTISAAASHVQGKPGLVFFYSPVSGACRRAEGFLAQVLQRRRNHGTFKLYRVDEQERPDLVERFGIETMPTLVVVEDKVVRARLERPRGCREIENFLAPWLH
jgi:thioredoxin-like negative regulator of GroEL